MQKSFILLVAGAVVALAVWGTVGAQQPSGGGYLPQPSGGGYFHPAKGSGPSRPTPTANTPTAPVVRPYSEWAPNPPKTVYTPTPTNQPQPSGSPRLPAGGGYLPPSASGYTNPLPSAHRLRLSQPGFAGGEINPTGGFDVPPPSMELPRPNNQPVVAPSKTASPLPPPSVSLDSHDNKFPPVPAVQPPSPGEAPAALPTTVLPPPSAEPVAPAIPPSVPLSPASPVVLPPSPPVNLPQTLPKPEVVATPPVVPRPLAPLTGSLPSGVSQSVTVQAVCDEILTFNEDCRYELVVKNEGNAAVQNVRVEDQLPAGVRYIGSDPPGELNGDRLVWAIGTLESKSEKRIAVRVRPTEEGELRSRAIVSYTAAVDVKLQVTRPRLAISATCIDVCRTGEDCVFQIQVTNSGSGPAKNLVLRAEMSGGLLFAQSPQLGAKLETTLESLPAGSTKTLSLPLNATKAGLQSCQFTVSATGCDPVSTKATVNVVEPQLHIKQTGPATCLVRSEPTYEITLSNPGTAATEPITLHAVLPEGFDFLEATDSGSFNPTTRATSWKLSGLPAGATKTVALKLRAVAAGDVSLRSVAVAAPERGLGVAAPESAVPVGATAPLAKPASRMLEAKAETPIKCEGVPAVRFEVKDIEDPILVGSDAVYEIRVTNQGTGACTNVQLIAAMSEGTTFSGANGPTNVKAQGQTLIFEAIPKLGVKEEMVYTVRVRGNTEGDHRFRVQLTCDQVRTPVVKEESSRFYKQ